MSDQDIERIARTHSYHTSGVSCYHEIVEALTELSALRDEETARLKRELAQSKEAFKGLLTHENRHLSEKDQLRARLAESVLNNDRLEESNSEFRSTTWKKDKAIQLLNETVNEGVKEMKATLAKQIALESQCQRMREALNLINSEIGRLFWTSDDGRESRDGDPKDAEAPACFIEAWEFVRFALSAPLDLELLNRVRTALTQAVESGKARCGEVQKGSPIDQWDQLLKSLSPAP